MTLSIMTFSIMAEHCYAQCHLCRLLHMLTVTYKSSILSVNMKNVVMLSVVMLSALAPFEVLVN
jgi:hypothetical protein